MRNKSRRCQRTISAPLFFYPTMLCAVFGINKIKPKTNILTKLVNNNKRKV
ncbi:MAG: hypothetical protein ACLTVA_04490 [Ruminococcus sp.]